MFVTVELGATLEVGKFGFVKPLIKIEQIDPSGDVEKQIALGIEIGGKALARIDEQLEVSISEIIATDNTPGYRQKVEQMQASMDQFRQRLTLITNVVEEKMGVAIRGKKESSK